MITILHSRAASIRRNGNPDSFTPCRITPSNYFRFLAGPEATTIKGREFIIPVDSLLGSSSFDLLFDKTPVSGAFRILYRSSVSALVPFNVTDTDLQAALRVLPGLENATVLGSTGTKFSIIKNDKEDSSDLITVGGSTLEDVDGYPTTTTVLSLRQKWVPLIKKGDKLLDDSTFGLLTIDEILEMPDLGGSIMGLRVRVE